MREDIILDNWEQFVDRAARVEELKAPGIVYISGMQPDPDFRGVDSFEEALTLARNGWVEGMKQARNIADPIVNRITGQIERLNLNYDVTGEVLDVGRYCTGEPEHWGVWTREIVDGPGTKFLHIVVNGSARFDIDKEVIMRRGATLAAAIQLLELGGYRVKVTLAFYNRARGTDWTFSTQVPLKQFEDSLDMDRLIYALAHPSCLRSLCFCIRTTFSPELSKEIEYSMGAASTLPVEEHGDIYIDTIANDGQWESPALAEAWLIKKLKEYRVLKAD